MNNILGLHCSVQNGIGKLTVIILTEEDLIINIFKSPSVFSFKDNIGEILNWHKDNIISLISLFNINAIVVKKTERSSFFGRPKNSDFFKLYLEGVMLSLAGSIGLKNRHLEKNSIIAILKNNDVFNMSLEEIKEHYKIITDYVPERLDESNVRETLLTTIAYKIYLS